MDSIQLSDLIGRLGSYQQGNLVFEVHIINAKVSYGKTRIAIAPIAGQGWAWVDLGSVKVGPHKTGSLSAGDTV